MMEAIYRKRFVSLWEIMKRFQPQFFINAAVVLNAIDTILRSGTAASGLSWEKNYINPESEIFAQLKEELSDFKANCVESGLQMTTSSVDRALGCVGNPNSTWGDVNHHFKACSEILNDELALYLYYAIEKDKTYLVIDQSPFGDEVTAAFPRASYDIEEATRCLAFERWTAAVFHLGRIAEIAAVVVAKSVEYQSPKERFGEALKYIDDNLEIIRNEYQTAKPTFKGRRVFLSQVSVLMHAVADAWRNPVSHMDTKYTEEEALRIHSATKHLMQHISTELSQTDN